MGNFLKSGALFAVCDVGQVFQSLLANAFWLAAQLLGEGIKHGVGFN
jgi:hypothetical protein